ncbi:hypothetical protein WBP07_20575 (plasmid) [Novosphingobium sp. BL-8A]|uniref:hypothetical protein n=1 Tax=Novosphingobium sp. BL-8A TaxID=3127639 RepID=UPI003757059B
MIRDLHPHTRPQRTQDPGDVDHRARELGFEPSDWPVSLVFRGAPTLALLLGAALCVGSLAISLLRPNRPPAGDHGAPIETLAPRLQAHPASDLAQALDRQDRNLRQAPVPIERAMDEAAARGWREDRPTKGQGQ